MIRIEIIEALVMLGKKMSGLEADNSIIIKAKIENQWFTPTNQLKALNYWSSKLNNNQLESWLKPYSFASSPKKVGLIMAGNIPLVGLHDLICILVSGHIALVKYSSDDKVLMKWVCDELKQINKGFNDIIVEVDTLNNCDALIATGSNNTSRYFESYFKTKPRIIRKNRKSLAVLTGNETSDELKMLGNDIFDYFGLGCRNVSKLLVPKAYSFDKFYEALEGINTIMHHNKYFNNYTYHKAIFLMNLAPHLDNGFLILKMDEQLHSPLGCLFYSHYDNLNEVNNYLNQNEASIQAVMSNNQIIAHAIALGNSQLPELGEYADKVDTMKFLNGL